MYSFASALPFTCIVYFMVGFEHQTDRFFLFMLTIGGLSVAMNAFGHLIVAVAPNVIFAGLMGGLTVYVEHQ